MTEIKIRYTWKNTTTGNVWQRVMPIKSIEIGFPFPLIYKGNELLGRDLWTGWQDKNKTDIFCNDLISECGAESLYQVIWQSHAGQWIMQSLGEGRRYRDMAYDYAKLHYEVKGSIHQPPTTREP